MKLLDEVDYDKTSDDIIFLGDYIDRGKHSNKVVKFVRDLLDEVGEKRGTALLGNHEDMMVKYYLDDQYSWLFNGHSHTIHSYGDNEEQMMDDMNWFQSLPVAIETDDHIFCHAGLTHPAFKDNSVQDLIWGRNWLESEDNRPREKQVIFGHTPAFWLDIPDQELSYYTAATGDICIDSGCVYGGKLTAAILHGDDITFVSVPKHADD